MAAHTDENGPAGYSAYPRNAERTYKSKQALAAYRIRLREEEGTIFVSSKKPRFVELWELYEHEDEFRPMTKIEHPQDIRSTIRDDVADPRCRFVFLSTASSRGPLRCSLDQLTHVLSHHDVMPAFLDFCFDFRAREKPITTSKFRLEDHLATSAMQTSLTPGRSGVRIQHAFSIMAFEVEQQDGYPWPLRSTTVYHSFDMVYGKSLWIIVKANKIMQNRITSMSEDYPKHTSNPSLLVEDSFRSSLATHVPILEWCVNSWGQYTDHLERESDKHGAAVRLAPVEALARKVPRRIQLNGDASLGRSDTGFTESQPYSLGGRMRSNFSRITSGFSGYQQPTNLPKSAVPENKKQAVLGVDDDEELVEIFNFDVHQSIRTLIDNIEQALLVLSQNKKILASLLERYGSLAQTQEFARFKDDIAGFCQQVRVLDGDLDSHKARLETLLRTAERDEQMFKGIVEYGKMRAEEHFATWTQTSAKTMEGWTVKMHNIAAQTENETISMLVITAFTLLFLPGTFVATIFSSGILGFDNSTTSNLGDWEIRIPALKLFGVICIPLMVIALSCWYIFYRLTKRQHHALTDTTA